ncbi:MAG: ATP-binding cassette domain-containing protein [Arcobacter sp.]|jgi:molybdate transport system ATP-binding protein|uniref:Molybdenum ABC transporter ATP-binding protein n=1 Tax=Aliarcobacter cryaerophilus TaxID=28198 RepID=A0A1V9VA31_9BACT|nr:ATP-binding cassette domain-containing protein [Aliarcobacter cryaerophilus]MBK6303208.1 ATP-binding cassette domain-containing protein [Arcobacter sp.]MBP7251646.1 ATP-binding cassette domain-containing protein [Aliarcobacter sp.]MBK6547796.1 ATP-binding cassette domain-containing protein [Arcobacter sp.]MDD2974585.1 ATP-binding cassette domain-containing protein [Aliarcobacter cryaerophilus]OQR40960.1 molybdenum ABC transporter ATP-binding protein [Aliarcobacter cryaerophilus]
MIEIDIIKPLYTADGIINLKVNKKINKGDFLTLFGKSGSGKTTLLRILAGLETPKSGKIVVDKEIWFDSSKKINLAPQKRDVGFVFQDYALFPNMSVKKNLEFALKNKNEIKKVDEILEIMEIKNLSNMKPELLSGGQKQRVALARTLMTNPKILLLDEPLSALDTTMRLKLQDELSLIHQKFNITSILVSHDISEVFKLSNRVFKINLGEIEEDGTPNELFSNQKISSKFKIVGEILSIKKSDILYIIEILSNNEVVKATAVEDEIKDLKIGDKILLSSKAFNPIVNKI